MSAALGELVACLRELQAYSYASAELARRTGARARRALRLLAAVGAERPPLIVNQKVLLGNLIVGAVVPLKIAIERTACLHRTRLETSVLIERSALQLLLDYFGNFPQNVVRYKLQKVGELLERDNIRESVAILDKIIADFRADEPDAGEAPAAAPPCPAASRRDARPLRDRNENLLYIISSQHTGAKMFFKILNSIPVIGHIKGVGHYVVGDVAGGNRAMYESTRSGAVLAGGLAGAAGGAAGGAVGAVVAGALVDTLASLAAGGRRPAEPLAQLALSVASDAAGGLGGGAVAETVTHVFVTSTKVGGKLSVVLAKDRVMFAFQAIFAYCFARAAVVDRAERAGGRPAQTNNTSRSKKKESAASGSGSGSDPPEKNQNVSKTEPVEGRETHWDALLNIFLASSLDDICMGRSNTPIFKDLEDGQRRSLKKLISAIRRRGDTYFERIVRIVAKMFHKLDERHVTFQNFISLVHFVMTFVGEEAAARNERARAGGAAERSLAPFGDRLRALADSIAGELLRDISGLWAAYDAVRSAVSCEWTKLWPSFRDVASAAYHYYKHRLVGDTLLSVREYFDLIHSFLDRVHGLEQFSELSASRRELVYERYLPALGRRARLVLQLQDGGPELSSFYFLDYTVEGDRAGDEFVDGLRIPPEGE